MSDEPGQQGPGHLPERWRSPKPEPDRLQPGRLQPGQLQPGQLQPGRLQPGQPQPAQTSTHQPHAGRPAAQRASARPDRYTAVLIALNVAVWLLITATGGQASLWTDRLGLRPHGVCVPLSQPDAIYPQIGRQTCAAFGTWSAGVADGAYWQVITNVFTHVDLMHLGMNMLALFFLGPQLCRVVRASRYLAIYLFSGLTASGFVYAMSAPQTLTLGASGAIFGLLGALLVVVWRLGGDMRGVLAWLGINVAFTFLGPNISWQGHLGGLLGGLLAALVLVRRRPAASSPGSRREP